MYSMRLSFTALVLCCLSFTMAQGGDLQFDDTDMAASLEEALTFQKYPTYDQYIQMMTGFAEDHPHICRLDTFGTTNQGRLLLALKISDHPGMNEPEANFLYTSTMHGDEIIGYVLLLRLIDLILNAYGSDTEVNRLVDSLTIWINPLANPDGTYAGNNFSIGSAIRTTSTGVDLNRNFPDPDNDEWNDTTGRGRETVSMMEFMDAHGFTMSANIHSGVEVVNYPWDHTFDRHADDDWFRFISREYTDEAKAVDPEYMMFANDGITHGADWLPITGGRQDYVNYFLGGREVTLELSNTKLLESEFLEEYWNINQRSLLNYMSQCMYGIRGCVTSLESGTPVHAKIEIPGHDSIYSVAHSSPDRGDFYRLIKEGVYDLVISAAGYISDTIWDVPVVDYQSTWLNVGLDSMTKTTVSTTPVIAGFHIYPNPATFGLTVEPADLEHGPLDLRILSADGHLHYQKVCDYHGQLLQLSLQQLPRGIYILNIRSQRFVFSTKFVKQ